MCLQVLPRRTENPGLLGPLPKHWVQRRDLHRDPLAGLSNLVIPDTYTYTHPPNLVLPDIHIHTPLNLVIPDRHVHTPPHPGNTRHTHVHTPSTW